MNREPADHYTDASNRHLTHALALAMVCAYATIGGLLWLLIRTVTS